MVCDIVNLAQSGFIPGRQIVDNVLFATKLIKGYSWTNIIPRCTLKIDIAKAYESIEWSFLECVFKELGFPSPVY